MSVTVDLAIDLIARKSVTPEDGGCQMVIGTRLQSLGFAITPYNFEDTQNLWATHGSGSPVFVFAGHTDVVPTGPEQSWKTPPFQPTIRDGMLFGRGAADMKSGLAAMVVASEHFLSKNPQHKGTLAFLITSDEEGTGKNGTKRVVAALSDKKQQIDYCLVGEPTAVDTLGDTIKNGRRGSLNGKLTVIGKQGHVAYPERAVNPIHTIAPFLADFTNEKWDQGSQFFSPTTMQISNIKAGEGAVNVVPGTLEIVFNFRFSTAVTAKQLQERSEALLKKHKLNYELNWNLSGEPFLTDPAELTAAAVEAIKNVMDVDAQLSTSGGTSDARFIAPLGAQVLELGPINASIHKIDEHVRLADLDKLTAIYEQILSALL